MKELSKPKNFKSLKQIKLLKEKLMCIELKMHLLICCCVNVLFISIVSIRKYFFTVTLSPPELLGRFSSFLFLPTRFIELHG